jgi:hypothetical protein
MGLCMLSKLKVRSGIGGRLISLGLAAWKGRSPCDIADVVFDDGRSLRFYWDTITVRTERGETGHTRTSWTVVNQEDLPRKGGLVWE